MQIREVARVTGTGSVDDTYLCAGMYAGNLVVALEGGGVWLFNPVDGTTLQLPDCADTVTGATEALGRLWVSSGLKLRSIAIANGAPDADWTDAATVSDAQIDRLLGLARHLGSGKLFAGSYIATNVGSETLRCYAFTPLADGTATALTFPTNAATGPFNGPASVLVDAAPAYIAGPFPMAPGDARLYAIYLGSAPAFTNLLGAVSEDMSGVSLRILSYDGTHWHNGTDTATDDLRTDGMESAAGKISALYTTLDGRRQVVDGIYVSSGNKFPGITRDRTAASQPYLWSINPTGTVFTDWTQPPLWF